MRWIATLGMTLSGTLSASICARADLDEIKPVAGLHLTKSARIAPGMYQLTDPEDDGALVISGDAITIDFAGAAIIGAREGTDPDRFTGRGIVVRGKNVTLKNAKVHGYKIGIYAENSPGIRITGCDVSRNYRQRLKSTVTHEDLSDWLYGHENDNNEWMRYGAGIYLLNCPGATVANCRARNGQNGLCICRCDGTYVVDNDMSFMSGWGLAMWRSSRCDVFNNKFDWCIRGYSHGVYSRGQDSAGILVYEQCSDNVFAYNSVTHGGDGFFLYAGNETLKKTGKGGCNNNLVYRNDFSHAAANGIEATFSDGNRFIENILDECNHGVWAGYSSNSLIHRNTIRGCVNGVSIEHGRNNRVLDNTIEEASRGVHLWWDDDKDLLASAFGKANDRCLSTGNLLMGNGFTRVKTAVQLVDDTHSRVGDNTFRDVATALHVAGHVDGLRVVLPPRDRAKVLNEATGTISFVEQLPATRLRWVPLSSDDAKRLHAKKGKREAFLPEGAMRGRKYIFVDEWGPYDFSDVRLFPSRIVGGAKAVLQLLGPPESSFRVASFSSDVTVAPISGTLPARLTVTAQGDGVHDFAIDLETSGGRLHATGTLLRSDWRVAFYRWSREDDPRGPEENWKRIINAKPVEVINTLDVDFVWKYAAPTANLPPDHFATVAGTRVTLPKGRWRISTVSDDGVRVFINGAEVLANWTQHGPMLDEATISLGAGTNEIRIEHFEIDGYAQLQFYVQPARR